MPLGVLKTHGENAEEVGLDRRRETEMRPLSLSRLQVLCHFLSKMLFKLSLTLLVRYRSSYSVFNLGRHIPAASRCIPKQRYSLLSAYETAVCGGIAG